MRGCNSEYVVKCYGAFYQVITSIIFYCNPLQQGVIGIALEYMDMGSLADIVKTIGPIPEVILGYITYQVY